MLLIITLISLKEVVIDEHGFNPNSLYIIQDSQVTWVNKGKLPHWPASNPHPIHTDYPSKENGCIGSILDSCRELGKGESYSFTFDQIGSWGIHDHLFHTNAMTVNVYNSYPELLAARIKTFFKGVKDKFKKQSSSNTNVSLDQTVNSCSNVDRTKFIACLKIAIKDLVDKLGVKNLLTELETSYKQDDSSSQGGITRCHDIAHAIGQAGITMTRDPKVVLDQCTDLCTSGCFHGAVEQATVEQSAGTFLSNLNTLCSREACYHGLGHGLASIAGYDLQKSLQLCDRLNISDGKRNCGFGVFMELFEPSSFNPTPKTLPEDLLKFCTDLSGAYLEICYRNIGTYEYARTNQNMEKALIICLSIPENYHRECKVALGQMIYFNKQGASAAIVPVCKNSSSREYKDCIDGALMASISSDPIARHGFELCNQIDESMKKGCYQFLGDHIQEVYGRESRLSNCNQIANNMIRYNECAGTNSEK